MAKTVDARGLSCPQPVLMTLNEIKAAQADEIVVMVDNEASRENVCRAANSKGWSIVDISTKDDEYIITIRKN